MMMRMLLVIAAAFAIELPEDEQFFANKRQLQSHGGHSSGGHSSGGHSSGGHSSGSRPARPPDATQTGCTPPAGGDLPKTTASSADNLNEPCYVHDAACDGYPVCCVKAGTCVSEHGGMVSSNAKYYMGGCVSPNSRAGALPDGCAKQGECHAMYLQHMKGGTTKAGLSVAVSPYVTERMMKGADGCAAYFTPPIPIWAFILIGVGALLVLIVIAVVIMKKMKKPATAAKGAPQTGAEIAA